MNILCFGDSNTFGTIPCGGRWRRDQRWTGILQKLLGDGHYVIEEGLGGRTISFDDPIEPDKNGMKHLPVLLRSHRPLNLVIIMLGTNDLKARFAALPQEIAHNLSSMGELVKSYCYGPSYPVPEVMLMSPPHIREGVGSSVFVGFDEKAAELSHRLAPLYRNICEEHGWLYLDAAQYAQAGEADCLHMESEGHSRLAQAIADRIHTEYDNVSEN